MRAFDPRAANNCRRHRRPSLPFFPLLSVRRSRAYGLGVSIRGEMELAYQGEILTPSQCGRMDQACAYGPCPVVLHYDGEAVEVEELLVGAPLHLVVADLHAAKDTVIILEKLRECFPHPRNATEEGVVALLGPINKRIVETALKLIAEGNAEALGKLMVEAQAEFDKAGGAACPEQLTAPVLHKARGERRRVFSEPGEEGRAPGALRAVDDWDLHARIHFTLRRGELRVR